MFSNVNVILILICNGLSLIHFSQPQPTPQDAAWPFIDNVPFPYPTLSPINLNSSEAKPINVSPLVNVVRNSTFSVLENFGFGLRILPLTNDAACLTGGVLLNDRYLFYQQGFTWDGSFEGRAADEVDNVGTPLQTQFVYYNSKYQTFDNALKFRDGIAIILFNVIVEGQIANPKFTQFQNALNKVVLCGSRTVNPTTVNIQWITGALESPTYYSFPGAYIDYRTRQQFESATNIFIPADYWPTISRPQFSTFLNLLNSFGQSIANTLPLRCNLRRPFVQASGIIATTVA